MDKFVIFKKEKRIIGDFIGNLDVFNTIATAVGDNDMICIYGGSGVGKTYIVDLVLKNENFVEISSLYECQLLGESSCHVLIDSINIDKSILDHRKKLSKGSTIIVTRSCEKVDFCPCVELGPMTSDMIVKIGKKKFPNISEDKLQILADKSFGNIRTFLFSIQFEDERDSFYTTKQFVSGLLTKEIDPMDYLDGYACEHGHVWDVIFTNQSQFNPEISELHSDADIYDSKLYNNNWELLSHFWISGMVYPIMKMDCVEGPVKPGSSWTKFWNSKMRLKKMKKMPDINRLFLLKEMVIHKPTSEVIDILREYKITSADMDTMNHIALDNKIKTKKLQEIKKLLKQ